MPLARPLDSDLDHIGRSLPQPPRRARQASLPSADPSSFSLNLVPATSRLAAHHDPATTTPIIGASFSSRHMPGRAASLDAKQDTRIVNEAFQDAVAMLEEGFDSKMQAEMLVLVDVLHTPASIFPANSSFRQKAQDKHFIGK